MRPLSPPTCPRCGSQTKVTNTFHAINTRDIVRHRKCTNCGHQIYTSQPQEQIVDKHRIFWPKWDKSHEKGIGKTVRLLSPREPRKSA